jgi:hypothetical protein
LHLAVIVSLLGWHLRVGSSATARWRRAADPDESPHHQHWPVNLVSTIPGGISMLIHKLLLGAALTLATLAIPSVAAAAPAVPGGETSTYSFPAGEYCAFPVQITLVSNEIAHDSGQGRVVYTGALSGTVTNLATGASRTYNLSGPGFDGGNTVTGPQLIGQPAWRDLGSTFLIVTYGRVTVTPEVTIATQTGSVTDICADLA